VKIDLDQIRDLLEIVSENDITELTVQSGEEKVTIRKSSGSSSNATADLSVETVSVAQPAASSEISFEPKSTASEVAVEPEESATGLLSVTSPMVGTFYRAASPTTPPYVEVGDRITVGQTICIIEAMKLMNDMPSEVAGRVVKICVENGSTIEYGQHLFLVDPNG